MARLVTSKRKSVIRKPTLPLNVRDLLIKRPPSRSYQDAINLWKAKLKRYGTKKLARAKKLRGRQSGYLQIGRSAAYAGDAGIKALLIRAGSTASVAIRDRLLDLIESIRKMRSSIQTLAAVEHFWPDGSAAVSVYDKRIGWLEFDLIAPSLPGGLEPGSSIPVRLYLDAQGNVVRHQVPPGAKVIPPPPGKSGGGRLGSRLPARPKDWNDEADVARYDRELEEWEKRSSLGKRPSDVK